MIRIEQMEAALAAGKQVSVLAYWAKAKVDDADALTAAIVKIVDGDSITRLDMPDDLFLDLLGSGRLRMTEVLNPAVIEYELDYLPCAECGKNVKTVNKAEFTLDQTGLYLDLGPYWTSRDRQIVCSRCSHNFDLYQIEAEGVHNCLHYTRTHPEGIPLEINNYCGTLSFVVTEATLQSCGRGKKWTVRFSDHLGMAWRGVAVENSHLVRATRQKRDG